MSNSQIKAPKCPHGILTSPVSRFAARCTGVVKERWQQWVPWEWAIRKGLGNSLHFFCHATSFEKPKHLSHLYPVPNPEDMDTVLKNISEKYNVISTEEYVDRVQRGELKGPNVLATVTCDDGLREFKTYLWPIMKKYSIPCTLFLVKNFVEENEYLYRFKISLLLDVLDKPGVSDLARNCLARLGRDIDKNTNLKKIINGIHNPEDHWLLDELADSLGVSFEKYFKDQRPFLNRIEVIQLHNEGVRLGSHGIFHYRYDFLSPRKIREDILDGVAYIQELAKQKTVEHAFPFIGNMVPREFLQKILSNQSVLTHFFDSGGINRDVPFVTHRITLDSEVPQNAIRQAAYQYIRSNCFLYRNSNRK